MTLDWRRLKAVVLESDDWGLCAWSPDDAAHRALADTPVFRSAAGRAYGRSTLESAEDVRALAALLAVRPGADDQPAVWQANTVLAAPDYDRLTTGTSEDEVPLVYLPELPSRWRRPGLWDAVAEARAAGVWWPELHGLHHLPLDAWTRALRRGDADARRALAEQSPVCEAVARSSEYDPSEPAARRSRDLERAVLRFTEAFGRPPVSICPPDYRWDERLEREALALGVRILQGSAERVRPFARLRRRLSRPGFPERRGSRLAMPRRIAFEPRGEERPAGAVGVDAALRASRDAWIEGRPAVVSSHRLNYAHLDRGWSEAGRAALATLLGSLAENGASFLVDHEVAQLVERGWSMRPLGERGALVRCPATAGESIDFAAPAGVTAVTHVAGGDVEHLALEAGELHARLGPGVHRLDWGRA